jgi:hypothetical protein
VITLAIASRVQGNSHLLVRVVVRGHSIDTRGRICSLKVVVHKNSVWVSIIHSHAIMYLLLRVTRGEVRWQHLMTLECVIHNLSVLVFFLSIVSQQRSNEALLIEVHHGHVWRSNLGIVSRPIHRSSDVSMLLLSLSHAVSDSTLDCERRLLCVFPRCNASLFRV